MHATIAVITARAAPRLEWLVKAIAEQERSDDEIQIVVVDLLERSVADLLGDPQTWPAAIVDVSVVPPKSTPYQGRDRLTSQDLHAIANARNTALVYARSRYVAFLDDCVRPGARYLEILRAASRAGAIVCGPCDKIIHGSGVPRVLDDRTRRRPAGGEVPGDWLYGGNFAAPLEVLLDVGGHEEGTDPFGRQDRVLGVMLSNRGHRIEYVPAMGCLFERELANPHPLPRVRPRDKGQAIVERFYRLRHTDPATTPQNLRTLRRVVADGGSLGKWHHGMTADMRDWYDDSQIGEILP